MTAPSITLSQDGYGPSVFYQGSFPMIAGVPYVGWTFRMADLEEWLTTIEELEAKSFGNNARCLMALRISLQCARQKGLEQHEQIQGTAPTVEGLQAYLEAYATAMNQNKTND